MSVTVLGDAPGRLSGPGSASPRMARDGAGNPRGSLLGGAERLMLAARLTLSMLATGLLAIALSWCRPALPSPAWFPGWRR